MSCNISYSLRHSTNCQLIVVRVMLIQTLSCYREERLRCDEMRPEFPKQQQQQQHVDTHNTAVPQQPSLNSALLRDLADITSPHLLQQHVMRKQTLGTSGGSLYTSVPLDCDTAGCVDIRTGSEKNYPDLLEISPYNLSSGGVNGGPFKVTDNSFCTLPRRRGGNFERGSNGRGSARIYRGSDSQSPLLPDSQYGSSGGEGSGGSNGSIPRRSSIESYSSCYPLSVAFGAKRPTSIGQQKSSSSLNLTSPTASSMSTDPSLVSGLPVLPGRPRKAPSLPTSPDLDRSSASKTPVSATPLLNLMTSNALEATDPFATSIPAVSSVPSTAANTYDYHAAQLERFLEEYRSLQEQLCKMKQTCENFRQQDSPSRTVPTPTPTISRFVDPLIYTPGVTTPSGPDDSNNPKSILKNKSSGVAVTAASASSPLGIVATSPVGLDSSAGAVDYGSELPPYWLPRNTLLRRFSGGDFYQS